MIIFCMINTDVLVLVTPSNTHKTFVFMYTHKSFFFQFELENWVNSIHSACAAAFARHRGKTGTLHLLQEEIFRLEKAIETVSTLEYNFKPHENSCVTVTRYCNSRHKQNLKREKRKALLSSIGKASFRWVKSEVFSSFCTFIRRRVCIHRRTDIRDWWKMSFMGPGGTRNATGIYFYFSREIRAIFYTKK